MEISEQREIFQQVKFFLGDLHTISSIQEVFLKELLKIKREERQNILELLKPYVSLFFEDSHKDRTRHFLFFITIIENLKKGSLEECSRIIQKLNNISPDTEERLKLVYMDISPEEKKKFCELNSKKNKQVKIIETPENLNINLLQDLGLTNITEDEQTDLFNSLKKIKSEIEQREIIKIASNLKTSPMNGFDCAQLIDIISEINTDQRSYISEEIQPFKGNDITVENLTALIKDLFKEKNSLKRKEISQAALSIIGEKVFDIPQKVEIIEGLSCIKQQNIFSVAKLASKLLSSSLILIEGEIQKIIKELENIEEREFEEILNCVHQLTPIIGQNYSFPYLFHDIKVLGQEKRKSISDVIYDIFEEGKANLYELTEIIDILKWLGEEDRKKVAFIINQLREKGQKEINSLALFARSLRVDYLTSIIKEEL